MILLSKNMVSQISVVINTINEEVNIKRAINSVNWADEILVCDMHSEDKTVEIAKSLGAKVIYHDRLSFVEPARNFAISKTSNQWVLILDPDEEVSEGLKQELIKIVSKGSSVDYVRIPRKNIIFGKWIKASMWWPDLNIRLFKKGSVKWSDKIHMSPKTSGTGMDLVADEYLAILHYHYDSLSSYLERMIRYTHIQATELKSEGYIFDYADLIKKPLSEFLSRFFVNRGFEDGIHGLALSLLQAFSFLVLYLRVWEMEKFRAGIVDLATLKELGKKSGDEIDYWFKYCNLSKNLFKRLVQKVKNKL